MEGVISFSCMCVRVKKVLICSLYVSKEKRFVTIGSCVNDRGTSAILNSVLGEYD